MPIAPREHESEDRPLDETGAEVHVWTLELPSRDLSRWSASCASLLSAPEVARAERLRGPRLRCEFVLSHALLRLALARVGGRPASRWRFVTDELGRPELDPTQGAHLSFNLSHTSGLVACVVADRRVGIDVEDHIRDLTNPRVAARVLSAAELRAREDLDEGAAQRDFFTRWTLKEALAKATGQGLRLPFSELTFDLARAEATDPGTGWRSAHLRREDPAAPASPPADGSPEDAWNLWYGSVGDRHSIALCVWRSGTPPRVQLGSAHLAADPGDGLTLA